MNTNLRDHKTLPRNVVILLLVVITLIAAGLRLYGLDKQSLWYDEVHEEESSRDLYLDSNEKRPATSLLNPFFIHFATKFFPRNDFALRTVPFLFGTMSIPLFFFLARRVFGANAALLASFYLAISPFHIWYSQDARMYALQWMLAIVSLLFYLRTLERPSAGNSAGYIISTTACLYTHQLAMFLLLIQGLYLVINFRKYAGQLLRWSVLFSLTLILYSPWIIHTLTSLMSYNAGTPKEMDLNAILFTMHTYSVGYSIGPSLRELHINTSIESIRPYAAIIGPIAVMYFTLLVSGTWALRKDGASLVFILVVLIVPIGFLFIMNVVMPNISYNVRYTGIAFLGFVLLVTKGIEQLWRIRPRKAGIALAVSVLLFIIAVNAYSYRNYHFDIRYHKADCRGAAEYISSELRKGDTVLCLLNSSVINRYAKKRFTCNLFKLGSAADKSRLEANMKMMLKGKKRLWFVLSTEWYSDNILKVKDWLDENYAQITPLNKGTDEIANMHIYVYDLNKELL